MARPWLTLPEWVEAQATHHHGLGNDAAQLVAETLDGLARSIRFHGATSRAEYLDHVEIMRESFEETMPDH